MGDFYGYNPAEYRDNYNFIGDAINNLGAGLSYIPEIKQARQQIDTDVNTRRAAASEMTQFAKNYSNDTDFNQAVRDNHYDGSSSEDMVKQLHAQGRFAGQDALTQGEGGAWLFDGQPADWEQLSSLQISDDIMGMVPDSEVFGRRGRSLQITGGNQPTNEQVAELGKTKGTSMSNDEYVNRIAQSMENYLLPIFQNSGNNIKQDVMYSALAVGEYGDDETVASINSSLNDNRQFKQYNRFKADTAQFAAELNLPEMPQMMNANGELETYDFGTVGPSALNMNTMAQEKKVTHSATQPYITERATQTDQEATTTANRVAEYEFANQLTENLLNPQSGIPAPDIKSGTGVDFFNSFPMEALQNMAWRGDDVIASVQSTGVLEQMSPETRSSYTEGLQTRVDNRADATKALFQRRTPNTPTSSGRVSSGDNPYSVYISSMNTKINQIDGELDGLTAKKKEEGLDAAETMQLDQLTKQKKDAQSWVTGFTSLSSDWTAAGQQGFLPSGQEQGILDTIVKDKFTNLDTVGINNLFTELDVKNADDLGQLDDFTEVNNALSASMGMDVKLVPLTEEMIAATPSRFEESRPGSIVMDVSSSGGGGRDLRGAYTIPRELLEGEEVNVSRGQEAPRTETLDETSSNRIMMDNLPDLLSITREDGGTLTDTSVKNFVESLAPEGTVIDKSPAEWRELTTLIGELSVIDNPQDYTMVGDAAVPTSVVQSIAQLTDTQAGDALGNEFTTAKSVIDLAKEQGVDLMGVPDNIIGTLINRRKRSETLTGIQSTATGIQEGLMSIGEYLSERVNGPKRETTQQQSGGIRIYGGTQ
jgi:hypothetical protein